MKKSLLTLLAFCFSLVWIQAQITYENFEGAKNLPWVGINGAYNGAVANPHKTGINTTDSVGSYTLNKASDFNFAIADLPAPADMAKYGFVKVKVWSPVAPSKLLLKFEGSGAAVEQFKDVTVANQWVEYTFNMTAGAANPTGLTKVLISFHSFLPGVDGTFFWDDMVGVEAKECYETFEGGGLTWQGLDGMFEGPVNNPAANKVNSSAKVGKYTKSNKHGYSLLLADYGKPMDLTVLNQFKLQIYTDRATNVLMKLEGAGGPAIEKSQSIAVRNAWQEYTFDFSARDTAKHLTKIILFFDPGVDTSAGVYYFDNLCAVPNACKGVTLKPDMIDDFECNRNATYGFGWDSLTVVNNPAPNPVNQSAKVGKYVDHQNEPWGHILIDYKDPMDMSKRNQIKFKAYSTKATKILVKLEGGVSPAKEVNVDVTELNQWVQYNADFSDQAASQHKKIVLFFNPGNNPAAGDVYYIDDIERVERPITVLETFELGVALLPWGPLDGSAVIHGAFSVVDNPSKTGINTTNKVGKYTKGTSAFSTLAIVVPGIINITQRSQFNIDILAPAGSTSVTMQLESVSQGNKEVQRNLKTPGSWETVSFDFTAHKAITDWVAGKLIFNPGKAEQGAMFHFDNVTLGTSTIDPCDGVVALPNIIDDFECQRNYQYGNGKDILSVANNPALSPANNSTKVGLYKDQPNQPWDALCVEFPAGIDLSVYNQFHAVINAPAAAVPFLFKLEGGTSPAKEIWKNGALANAWEKFEVDFSGEAGKNHKRLCIFFNGGVDHAGAVENYYIDNMRWARAGYTGCINTYESPASSISNFKYFANGHLEATGKLFTVVDNPKKAGINTSAKVGEFIKAKDGQPWAGMYGDLDAPIDFKGNKKIRAKVLMDHIGNFAIKLENSQSVPPAQNVELPVKNTKMNEWEELVFDFSAVPDNAKYQRLTIFFDLAIDATGKDVTSYFDDIVVGTGTCTPTSVFTTKVDPISISPNPVFDMLRVENPGKVSRIDIFNLLGRRVASVSTGNDSVIELDVTNFAAGVYMLAGFGREGQLIGNAKFAKQ